MKRLVGTLAGALALVLAAACAGSGTLPTAGASPPPGSPVAPASSVAEPTASEPTAPAASDPAEFTSALPPYTPGTYEERDTDGDGTADSFAFIFPAEQLAENLTLVRTISLAAKGADATMRMNLRYENTGSVPIQLTHRVVIPKEFAELIDELTMSVPFARIINPDPEGDLEIEIDPGKVIEVVAEAFKKHEEGGPSWNEKVWKVTLETGLDACVAREYYEGNNARMAACILDNVRNAMGHLGSGALADACRGRQGGNWNYRMNPQSVYGAACLAVANGSAAACDSIKGDAAALEQDMCRGYLAEAICRDGPIADPDDCLFEKALAQGSVFSCASIEDAALRIVRNAGVTGNTEYCKRLGDDKERIRACTEFVLAGKSGPLTPGDWFGDGGDGSAGGDADTPGDADMPPVEEIDTAWFPVGKHAATARSWAVFCPAGPSSRPRSRAARTTVRVHLRDVQARRRVHKGPRDSGPTEESRDPRPPERGGGEGPVPEARQPPSVPQARSDHDAKVEWSPSGERMTAAEGFYFDDVHGKYSRWSDEHTVVERYRNCMIAVVTHVSNHVGLRSTEQPPPLPPLSNEVDAQTEDLIEALRLIVDDKLAQQHRGAVASCCHD